MSAHEDGIELFTVPAGTKIDKTPDGLWLFEPPNEPAFTVTIDASRWPPTIIKTTVAPDCVCEIEVGSASPG